MKVDELPAGYMVVTGVAVHVAEVRTFTTDLQRFKKLVPLCETLAPLPPGSLKFTQALDAAMRDDPSITFPDVVTTFSELGAFNLHMAAELEAAVLEAGE